MELQVINTKNAQAGKCQLQESVFAVDYNDSLVHQAVVTYAAVARQGTKAQKNRSAVRGGGAKPWRQKGTGRARAGTIRSPLWRSGGVTFAAQPSDYSKKLNRKMYRAAIRSIYSELIRQNRLIVVDNISVNQPKTKLLTGILNEMSLTDVLIISTAVDENLYLSACNIPYVDVLLPEQVDPMSLIAYEKVLVTVGAVKQIEEQLA